MTASIGATIWYLVARAWRPQHLEELLAAADKALYRARLMAAIACVTAARCGRAISRFEADRIASRVGDRLGCYSFCLMLANPCGEFLFADSPAAGAWSQSLRRVAVSR